MRGVALSGIAAENLESGSGIASRTIASMEHGWGQGRDLLTARDVLVIDEAGMVGTRQLERVLSHAAEAGAKVVLVGDPQQLQSIEAGAAFRSIHERHGGAEIGEVRRQRQDWQRGRHARSRRPAEPAMRSQAYRSHGMVHEAANTRAGARRSDRPLGPRPAGQPRTHAASSSPTPMPRCASSTRRRANGCARRGDLGDEVRVDGRARRAQLRQRRPRHVPAKRARPWREERHARHHRTGQRAEHDRAHRRWRDRLRST